MGLPRFARNDTVGFLSTQNSRHFGIIQIFKINLDLSSISQIQNLLILGVFHLSLLELNVFLCYKL